jgi:hypothetical protein
MAKSGIAAPSIKGPGPRRVGRRALGKVKPAAMPGLGHTGSKSVASVPNAHRLDFSDARR